MKTQTSIKIGAQIFPLRITMGALVRFKRMSGKDISEVTTNDTADLILFIYCCIQSACNADGVGFEYSFEDFADRVDGEVMAQCLAGLNLTSKKKGTSTESPA